MAEDRHSGDGAGKGWRPGRVVAGLVLAALLGTALVLEGRVLWVRHGLQEARAALARYDVAAAETALGQCQDAAVGRSEYHLLAARAARQRGRYGEARTHLDACDAREAFPDEVLLERFLCDALEGDVRETELRLRGWAREPARAAPLWAALARADLDVCQPYVALKRCEEALKLDPDQPEALVCQGMAREMTDEHARALPSYRVAYERAPRMEGLRPRLAAALDRMGWTAEAAGHWEALRREQPDNPDVLLGLARCRRDLAEPEAAVRLLDAVLRREPDHAEALLERGRLALRQRRFAEAETDLARRAKLRPGSLEGQMLLLECLRADGRPGAKECARRVRELEEETARVSRLMDVTGRGGAPSPEQCQEIGTALARLDREAEAVPWLLQGLKARPGDAATHALLADWYRRQDRPERARRHAELAGESTATAARPAAAAPGARGDRDGGTVALVATPEAATSVVQSFCAQCHPAPPPDVFPRDAWRRELKRVYGFVRDSPKGRLDVAYPSLEAVVRYYQARAPEELPWPGIEYAATPLPVRFETRHWPVPQVDPLPNLSHLSLVHLSDNRRLDVLACDMRTGQILLLRPYDPEPRWQVLARVDHPAHATVTDLDGDGIRDILVADLGSMTPTDDPVGSVVWLRGRPGGTYEPVRLLDAVGRVADVQVADFTGDGKPDLVVAAFGWRARGEVMLLENRTKAGGPPEFVPRVLDDRHGAIHVPVCDLNNDGKPDFVALFAQEHETIVAFVNEGGGRFRQETIYQGPHPAYGSSGIQLVDLNKDGKLDVLYTNGDVLDSPEQLRPYHGVQWLENRGTFPFTHHPLAVLPGAHRAVAADVDGDGDLDVAAVSLLPPAERMSARRGRTMDAVVLLEQTAPGTFVRHALEQESCVHVTCDAGDVFGDGRVHLVTGDFSLSPDLKRPARVTVWQNLGPAGGLEQRMRKSALAP